MCKLLSQLAHLSHCSFIKESDQVTASHRIHDCHNQWSNPISFHTYNPSVFIILFFPISVVIFHTQEVLITVPLLLLSKKCAIFIGWRHTWLVEQVSVKNFNCYIVVLSLQFDWQLPLWNFSPRIFRCSGLQSTHIHVNVWYFSEIRVLTHLCWFFQSDSRQRVPTLLQPMTTEIKLVSICIRWGNLHWIWIESSWICSSISHSWHPFFKHDEFWLLSNRIL